MVKANLKLNYDKVSTYVNNIFQESMHKKRQGSLSDAAFGLMNSKSVHLHHIGAGLAKGKTLFKKHATKQIDRLSDYKYYEGIRGIKSLYNEIINSWNSGDEYYIASAPLESFEKLEWFFLNIVRF